MKKYKKLKIRVWLKFALAFILFLAGFGAIVFAVIKDISSGVGVVLVLLAAFGSWIASLVTLFKSLPEAVEVDFHTLKKHMDEKTTLNEFELTGAKQLERNLLNNGFKECEDGFLMKKKFSFWYDSITYYVYITENLKSAGAIDKARALFGKTERKGKNRCILLFAYIDTKQEKMKNEHSMIYEYAKISSISSNFKWDEKEVHLVPVLVDQKSNQGYILQEPKLYGMGTIYKKGCKMVKKIGEMNNQHL